MNEKQAQGLTQTIQMKSRAWMADDVYGAFLRNDIFGSSPQEISIVPVEKGGFAVHAQWEYLDETFHSAEEWDAFAANIDERMELAALGFQSETEQREDLYL